jgi:hypothetical protein
MRWRPGRASERDRDDTAEATTAAGVTGSTRGRASLGSPRSRALAPGDPSRRLHEMRAPFAPAVALVQGVFYALTGVWALVDLDSFMAITGPKTDRWLVKTVGVLVTVIGAVLLLAWRRREVPPEVMLLAIGSALSLAAIDIIYVSNRTISPIYLLDAVAEVGLALAWIPAARRG